MYFWGILFLVLTVMATTTIPQCIRRGIEMLQYGESGLAVSDADQLVRAGWQIIGLGVLLCIFRVLSRIYIFVPGRHAEEEVRQDYYDACITVPPRYLSNFQTGDLVSRGTADVASVRVLLSMGVLHTINSVVMFGFCLFHMLRISPRLTVICLLTLPVIAVLMRFLADLMMSRSRSVQKQLGTLTETIRELLRAHSLLTIYPVFNSLFERFRSDNKEYRDRSLEVMSIRVWIFNATTTLSSLATFILILIGGPLVINDKFTIAQFVEYSVFLGLIQDPLRAWGFLISIFQRGEVCLERIYGVRDLVDEVQNKEAAKPVADVTRLLAAQMADRPLVSIRNLTFAYESASHESTPDRKPFALQIDALDIMPGTKYGIFGQTGSGKTTLLNLLTGNLATPKATCFFAGIDYVDIAADILLKQFSIAAQDSRHFDGSIGGNLEMIRKQTADDNSDMHRMTSYADAYEISQLGADIEMFSDGLDTVVGEHGIRLSGGQRQRLAILRALLKPRQLLALDDIVAAVDHETESKILAALFARLADETLIIISHRISALTPCDEILIMAEGEIVARGTHDELLQSHDDYRATYHHQVVEQQLLELEND